MNWFIAPTPSPTHLDGCLGCCQPLEISNTKISHHFPSFLVPSWVGFLGWTPGRGGVRCVQIFNFLRGANSRNDVHTYNSASHSEWRLELTLRPGKLVGERYTRTVWFAFRMTVRPTAFLCGHRWFHFCDLPVRPFAPFSIGLLGFFSCRSPGTSSIMLLLPTLCQLVCAGNSLFQLAAFLLTLLSH